MQGIMVTTLNCKKGNKEMLQIMGGVVASCYM